MRLLCWPPDVELVSDPGGRTCQSTFTGSKGGADAVSTQFTGNSLPVPVSHGVINAPPPSGSIILLLPASIRVRRAGYTCSANVTAGPELPVGLLGTDVEAWLTERRQTWDQSVRGVGSGRQQNSRLRI